MKTRAIVINHYGGKEELVETQVELPVLGEHQVLVQVKATSINPIDWKVREGYLRQMFTWEFPIILGWDVAGVIEEVGSQVTDWQVGDRVFARPATTKFGTYADHTIVDDNLLVMLPETVSFEEGAAMPLAGLTAYQSLFDHGKLEAGQKVLIHAGAGGVGSYAIQLAKEKGAYVYATASEKNRELVESLGADEVIDYHTTDFVDVVSDIDVVLDTMGGDVQRKSLSVIKPNGYLISIVGIEHDALAKEKQVTATGIWLNPSGEQLNVLADLMVSGKLKSVIGAEFPLTAEGIHEAHALSETHHAVGKIVIRNNQ